MGFSGWFDLILASGGTMILSGESSRDRLVSEFGEKGFDFASNDRRDVVVWPSARKAVVVNLNPQVVSRVAKWHKSKGSTRIEENAHFNIWRHYAPDTG